MFATSVGQVSFNTKGSLLSYKNGREMISSPRSSRPVMETVPRCALLYKLEVEVM